MGLREGTTEKDLRVLILCCVAAIAALLVVGVVSHGVLRHIVQTSPLWIGVVLGLRGSDLTKWATLPCFVFWLLVMVAIWLFLLGWARIVSGTFSSTEIAMTVVVGAASIAGIIKAAKVRSGVGLWPAIATGALLAVIQVVAFRVSMLPHIAHD
ncbi:MAG TPA: hypothetical protein VEJ47_09625 [Candidatus Eremiobacteraceae bacterium]|nr:hypothetical protein [Candidatus Eremiobacteraceae bacterium]